MRPRFHYKVIPMLLTIDDLLSSDEIATIRDLLDRSE
jgi:hypothetical protein